MNLVHTIKNGWGAAARFGQQASQALAADKARKADADRKALKFMVMFGIVGAVLLPELALAAPWDAAGTWVLNMLNSGLTRTIAIVCVVAAGIAALAGKLSWDWAIKIVIGIALIFGAAAIVDAIITAVSA
jgi:type IV secretion system protein VirB2